MRLGRGIYPGLQSHLQSLFSSIVPDQCIPIVVLTIWQAARE
jgi:hypothetical protein